MRAKLYLANANLSSHKTAVISDYQLIYEDGYRENKGGVDMVLVRRIERPTY